MAYHVDSDTLDAEPVDRLQINGIVYVPPQSELVTSLTGKPILLPSGAQEYENALSLVREVRHFVTRYLHLDDVAVRNMFVAYIFMSWLFDRFDAVPYLRVHGDFSSGKTRASR